MMPLHQGPAPLCKLAVRRRSLCPQAKNHWIIHLQFLYLTWPMLPGASRASLASSVTITTDPTKSNAASNLPVISNYVYFGCLSSPDGYPSFAELAKRCTDDARDVCITARAKTSNVGIYDRYVTTTTNGDQNHSFQHGKKVLLRCRLVRCRCTHPGRSVRFTLPWRCRFIL